MIRLLCFDLDGTLIDSAGDICSAVNRTLDEYNHARLDPRIITSHIGEGLRPLLRGTFPDITDVAAQDRLVERFLEIYEEEMLKTTTLFEGYEEFLSGWDGLIAIITNKNEKPTHQLLEHLTLKRFPWTHIIGADTLTEKKPSPLALHTVMKATGCTPAETLMVGDGIPDMVSAQRAGVGSIAIGFGYTDVKILSQYEPLAVLDHPTNLHGLIASLS